MGFYLKYTKRIIGSVLLAGVVSSSVVSVESGGAANLGNLNSKEKRTGSSGTQQGLEDSANFDIKDSNQTFLSHNKNKKGASGISAKDDLKAKKDPSNIDIKADKQTTKGLVYTANDTKTKTKGRSSEGKGIVTKPSYLKGLVDAVKSSDSKAVGAAVLVPTSVGGTGALVKKYLSNKNGNTAPIPDPVDPDHNGNKIPSAPQDEMVKRENSKAVYLWVILGVVLLAVLVVLFCIGLGFL